MKKINKNKISARFGLGIGLMIGTPMPLVVSIICFGRPNFDFLISSYILSMIIMLTGLYFSLHANKIKEELINKNNWYNNAFATDSAEVKE